MKKKRRWKKRLPSLIAQRHSTFVVKRNVLQRFALQNLDEDADDGWATTNSRGEAAGCGRIRGATLA